MDVRLINPFIKSTERVFRLMVGCPVVPQTPQVFSSLPAGAEMCNAVINMEGGARGAVVLRFPSNIVLPVGMAFAGGSISFHDAYDALGELANMIVGSAKRDLSQRLVSITVPQIVIGDNDLGEVSLLSPWLYVPFTTSVGSFYLSVSITKSTVEAA